MTDSWDPKEAEKVAKAEEAWKELQESWAELRPPSKIIAVTGRASDMKSHLELACAKTLPVLEKYTNDKYNAKPVTSAMLADIMAQGISIFMEKWHDELRSQNIAGLIEIILEAQDLSPTDMKGFIQALPLNLLDRILDSAIGLVPGVHGLIAIERALRARNIRDYTLGKEGARTYVSFFEPNRQVPVKFYLDEWFEGKPKTE